MRQSGLRQQTSAYGHKRSFCGRVVLGFSTHLQSICGTSKITCFPSLHAWPGWSLGRNAAPEPSSNSSFQTNPRARVSVDQSPLEFGCCSWQLSLSSALGEGALTSPASRMALCSKLSVHFKSSPAHTSQAHALRRTAMSSLPSMAFHWASGCCLGDPPYHSPTLPRVPRFWVTSHPRLQQTLLPLLEPQPVFCGTEHGHSFLDRFMSSSCQYWPGGLSGSPLSWEDIFGN